MSRFDTIDLSELPAPQVVEVLDFDAYKRAFIADFKARCAEVGFEYDADWLEGETGFLESDLMVKIFEVGAYRETILRQRVNDAARQVMLAFATGGNLENLGALMVTARLEDESDTRYRERVQLAPESFSTCGPEGAYYYHALATSTDVKGVALNKIEGTGEVHILPLMSSGDGSPTEELLSAVRTNIVSDDKIPFTDIPIVRAPTITYYNIVLRLQIATGPDAQLIVSQAKTAVDIYVNKRHGIGRAVYLSGIKAAAMVGGVENVIADEPLNDLVPASDEAFWCEEISINSEVIS